MSGAFFVLFVLPLFIVLLSVFLYYISGKEKKKDS